MRPIEWTMDKKVRSCDQATEEVMMTACDHCHGPLSKTVYVTKKEWGLIVA